MYTYCSLASFVAGLAFAGFFVAQIPGKIDGYLTPCDNRRLAKPCPKFNGLPSACDLWSSSKQSDNPRSGQRRTRMADMGVRLCDEKQKCRLGKWPLVIAVRNCFLIYRAPRFRVTPRNERNKSPYGNARDFRALGAWLTSSLLASRTNGRPVWYFAAWVSRRGFLLSSKRLRTRRRVWTHRTFGTHIRPVRHHACWSVVPAAPCGNCIVCPCRLGHGRSLSGEGRSY